MKIRVLYILSIVCSLLFFVNGCIVGAKLFPVTNTVVKTEVVTEYIVEEKAPFFPLSDEEMRVAACIVQGEAGTEDYTGKCLVAQCLLQACLDDGIMPSKARKDYQYAGWSDTPSEEAIDAVKAVFFDGYKVTVREIKYFYAPRYCNGEWHETQTFVLEYGGHKFFEENDTQRNIL